MNSVFAVFIKQVLERTTFVKLKARKDFNLLISEPGLVTPMLNSPLSYLFIALLITIVISKNKSMLVAVGDRYILTHTHVSLEIVNFEQILLLIFGSYSCNLWGIRTFVINSI